MRALRGFLSGVRWRRVAASCVMLSLGACSEDPKTVIAYVSVDRDVAQPVLRHFSEKTGIRVLAAYDTEANKTVGLVNRLIAEMAAPRADIFWSGEPARTAELCRRRVLEPAPQFDLIKQRIDTDVNGVCWRGFAGRIRVLLVRRDQSRDGLTGLGDLAKSRWRDRACIADPHFGSTGTHFAALYASWGDRAFQRWLADLKANGVALLPGNAQVKEAVVGGACWLGLTDSDDALAALAEGAPVEIVIPDQRPGEGTFVIVSTVSFVRGAPHAKPAAQLMDYLLSGEVERSLSESRAGFFPMRHALASPTHFPSRDALITMQVAPNVLAKVYPAMLHVVETEWQD